MSGRLLLFIAALLAALTGAGPLRAGGGPMLELEILGDAGVGFSGDCRLTLGNQPERRYRLHGTAPAKYWLPGDAARCSFSKTTGPMRQLTARIVRDGRIEMHQASPPPFRWLSISSTGPWGEPQGIASAARPLWQ